MPDVVIERVMKLTVQEEGGREVAVFGQDLGVKVDKSTYERVHVWRKVWFILSLGVPFFLFGGGVSWESVLDSQYARVLLETGVLGYGPSHFCNGGCCKTTRQAYLLDRGLVRARHRAGHVWRHHRPHCALRGHHLVPHRARIMEPYWFLLALTVSIRNEAITRHTQRYLARKRAQASAAAAPARIGLRCEQQPALRLRGRVPAGSQWPRTASRRGMA
jgi:hypothetical protein